MKENENEYKETKKRENKKGGKVKFPHIFQVT